MESTKIELQNKIIYAMDRFLDKEQLKHLQDVLSIEMHKYDVEPEKYEIVEYENYDKFIIEQYYASLAVNCTPKTIERYMYELRRMSDAIQKPIQEIRAEDIRYYLAMYQKTRKVSKTTLDGTRRCISAFYTWAEDNDYVVKSPTRKIKQIKKDTVKESALSQGQIESCMLSTNKLLYKSLIQFLYDTAARIDEACKVNLNEIDFNNRSVLLHGKGEKDRIVYFSDKTEMYLRMYLDSRKVKTNQLFATERTGKLCEGTAQQVFRVIGERAGVAKFHPHRLRVTRITDLIDHGMPIQDVQYFAGHSSISTTEGYYRRKQANIEGSFRRAA